MPPLSALAAADDPAGRFPSLDVAPGFWKADIIYVLLVEDDDVDAKLIDLYAAGLTNPQIVIARAVSTSEARALLAEWTFDLCILDFWLGCESSLRLLAELGDREVVVPTIVLTSLSTPDIDRMCQRAGASLFIGKEGLGPASLQAAIVAAIRTTATRTPAAVGPSTTGRSPTGDGRTMAAPVSPCAPGSGVAETREDAMLRLLTGLLGESDAGVDRPEVDPSGEPRPSGADLYRDSLLAALLDMTETVRFGLFEKALTARRPGKRIRATDRIEDAGGLIASAVAIARGVFDDRGQTVSFQRPEGPLAILCDPATFLFMMFELVLRASQQSASNSHVGISVDAGASALHVSLVSDRPTHAHAGALAFGPLFLQLLGDGRGRVHTVCGHDGRLRLACRLATDAIADEVGRGSPGIMARNAADAAPPGRASHHLPPDAG